LFVFNPFPGFKCIVVALKSRTVAHKTRTKFLLKFVRDISTKMTLSSFRASVSVRDLSTNSSADSGIQMTPNSPAEHIPGFEYRVTTCPLSLQVQTLERLGARTGKGRSAGSCAFASGDQEDGQEHGREAMGEAFWQHFESSLICRGEHYHFAA
jgi:hypothetical protein